MYLAHSFGFFILFQKLLLIFVTQRCYSGLNICVSLPPPNSYVEALIPSAAVLGDGAFIRLNEFIRLGPWSSKISVLVRRDTRELAPLPAFSSPSPSSPSCVYLYLSLPRSHPLTCIGWSWEPPFERSGFSKQMLSYNKFSLLVVRLT